MLREYRLTNFKAFGETVTIPIRPLTLIFGANSSGKSSIFQSLLLLKQTLEEAKNPNTALLPKGSLVDLGKHRDFVHRHDTDLEFEIGALFDDGDSAASTGLNIKFSFVAEENRITVKGYNYPDKSEKRSVVHWGQLWNRLKPSMQDFTESEDLTTPLEFQFEFESTFWSRWWNDVKEHIKAELLDHTHSVDFDQTDEPDAFLRILEDHPLESVIKYLGSRPMLLLCKYKNFLPTEFLGKLISLESFIRRQTAEVFIRSQLEGKISDEAINEEIDRVVRQSGTGKEEMDPLEAKMYALPYWARPTGNVDDEPVFERNRFVEEAILSLTILSDCDNFRHTLRNLTYLGPLRSQPERHYEFSGDTTDYVGQKGEYLPSILFQSPELLEPVNSDLKALGVKYKLKLDKLQYENESPSSLFSLRLVHTDTGIDASLRDVGFGIGQVLPIVVQSRLSEKKTLLIEQPEIHLHPAHQAELGDLFIRSAKEQGNTLLLETHSEHLLLRIMRRMRETSTGKLPEGAVEVRPEDIAVLFVESDGSQSIVREMPLNERGELVKAWPGGFFEEGLRESF